MLSIKSFRRFNSFLWAVCIERKQVENFNSNWLLVISSTLFPHSRTGVLKLKKLTTVCWVCAAWQFHFSIIKSISSRILQVLDRRFLTGPVSSGNVQLFGIFLNLYQTLIIVTQLIDPTKWFNLMRHFFNTFLFDIFSYLLLPRRSVDFQSSQSSFVIYFFWAV